MWFAPNSTCIGSRLSSPGLLVVFIEYNFTADAHSWHSRAPIPNTIVVVVVVVTECSPTVRQLLINNIWERCLRYIHTAKYTHIPYTIIYITLCGFSRYPADKCRPCLLLRSVLCVVCVVCLPFAELNVPRALVRALTKYT